MVKMIDPKRLERGLYWSRAWGLVDGCTKLSPGCKYCWSEKQSFNYTFQSNPKFQRYKDVMDFDGNWNGEIYMRWDNIGLPLHVKKPQVFAIWNDLFHESVSPDFIYKAFETMHLAGHHIFLVLTKREENLILLDDIHFHLERNYPDIELPLKNVCLGVSAENQKMADIRIPALLETPAAWRFVSIEPILEGIFLYDYFGNSYADQDTSSYEYAVAGNGLDWVICGEENAGPESRPVGVEAIRDLKNQCIEAEGKIPFFLKQMWSAGKLVKLPELDGKQWSQFPENITF